MADIALLTDSIDKNIGILIPPKKPIKQLNCSIVSTAISIRDKETLDLRIYVDLTKKPYEYASLEDYWSAVKPVLQQGIHPGLKAQKMFEMRYAVLCNDRTIVEGCDSKPRAAVLDGLQALINHYTSTPVEKPFVKRYSGRTDPLQDDFDHRIDNEMKFLRENSAALNAMIFYNADELKKIRAHAASFVEEVMYKTELKGIKDV